MKKNLAIIALTAGILLAVVFLAFHLHQTSKEKILSQFNEHQLLIARQTAIQIESYFRSRSDDVRWLSSFPSLRYRDKKKMPAVIQTNFKRLKAIHVKEISVLDEKGTVVYSTTGGAIGSNYAHSDIYAWAKKPVNKGMVRLTMEKADRQGTPATGEGFKPPPPQISFVTPIYQDAFAGGYPESNGKFGGVLSLSVDLEKVLTERTLLITQAMKLYTLWILDKDGTLLLQSEHPAMTMRNIREVDGTCNQCHASFDYAEKILAAMQGTMEYQIKGNRRKIAAFTPINFENASWIIVVNAPYDEVTGFIRGNLKDTMGLLGIVVLALSLASFSMHRNYRQKVSAQEEAKHLREKQGLMEALRETRDYLENLFGYANAPIIVWDPASRITRFNRAFERLTGYAAGEVIGQELRMLFPEGSREESLSRIARTLSGEYWESVEIPILRKDGETRLALWNSANLRAEDGSTVIATIAQGQDITERARAERDLRRRIRELDVLYTIGRAAAQSVSLQEILNNTVEATITALRVEAGGIFLLEPDGRTMTMSAHRGISDEFFKNTRKIQLGEGVSGRAAAERKPVVLDVSDYPSERLAPFVAREGFRILASTPLISAGGLVGALNLGLRHHRTFPPEELQLLETIGQMLGQAVRNVQLYESVQQELTERKRAEEALRETRDYLENLFGYANAPIIVWDPDFRITRFNRAFERLTGRLAGEVLGSPLDILFPSDRREEAMAHIRRATTGERWETVEIPILRVDGAVRIALWNSATLYAADGATIVVTIAQGQDITERKQAEETLRRQRDELDARSRILGAIFRTKDLNERLDLILDKVMEFLGVEFGCIYLVRGDAVELRSWRGITDEFRAHALSFPADRPPGLIRGPAVIHERLGDGSLMPEFAKSGGMQSCASFPLNIPRHGGSEEVEWLGTLVVGSRRFEALSTFDVEALHAMAGQLALAIDHARSYRHAEGRLARLQALRDIDRAIIQDIDLGQALHIVLERVPRELGADAAAISLLDETKLQMGVFSMRLPNGTFVEEEAFSLADSLLHWFVERQETIIIYDTMRDPRVQMNHRLFGDHRVFSYLGVPLIVQDKTIGVLHILTTHPKVFDAEDVEFFRTLAGQTAIAIENARANEVLRVSERKYRTLFEESKDVVYISTPGGRFIDINPAGVALFGYSSREELLAADIPRDLYVDPRDRERYRQAMSRDGYVKDFEVAMKRKDGEKLIVLSTATAEYDKNGSIVAYRGIMRDMTRFKQLEHQFTQSQKMEAIGRLSGGLAHDINNYLGAMTGYCELVKMTHEKNEELVKKMDVVVNIGFKASSLLKQLLAFSRKQPMRPEVVNLNRIMEGMEKMLRRLIGEDIRLETHLRKNIRNTKVDPSQIEQVLVNLVVNARNAMPHGGEITIETTTMEIDKDYLLNRPVAKAGEYVMLAVSDTGIGIPEEIRDKIFEPFFTTDADKGSGLGLSTVYGIVKQNEGYIWVYSEVGKGTTFKIYFPACGEDIPASEQQDTPAVRKEGSSRKILFVEDNDSMREAFRTVLDGMGYHVIAASNGEVALKHFAEQGRDVDLLITDVILPGMNGRELMDRMKETKKDLKVLFISGYTNNVIASRGILHEGINFLQKPFSAADLAEKITEVLGE